MGNFFSNDKFFSNNLVKKYGGRNVVNNVSIKVNRGEIVGLLGPNGAGKTTSFYMMVGLETPDSGNVFLNNIDITKKTIWDRSNLGIGYLSQEKSIFQDLNVEDNILLPLESRLISRKEQIEKLEALLKEFNIEKIRKIHGKNLSGGERRRVELARLLTIDPKFILLDEPFAGVDPIAISGIQNLIKNLKQKNIGILITDHNVDETLATTDRIYLLYNGEVLCSGTPNEIINNEKAKEFYLGNNYQLKI